MNIASQNNKWKSEIESSKRKEGSKQAEISVLYRQRVEFNLIFSDFDKLNKTQYKSDEFIISLSLWYRTIKVNVCVLLKNKKFNRSMAQLVRF